MYATSCTADKLTLDDEVLLAKQGVRGIVRSISSGRNTLQVAIATQGNGSKTFYLGKSENVRIMKP